MDELSLSDLIAPLRENLALIASITLVVTVAATAYTYFAVPTNWEADTSIIFEERRESGMAMLREFTFLDAAGRATGRGDLLEFLLESRSASERVVDRLDLMQELEVEHREAAAGLLRGACSVELPTFGVLRLRVRWPGAPRAALRGRTDSAAEMSARVAAEMIASLEEEVSHNAYTDAARKLAILDEQLHRANLELRQAEDSLVAYATDAGIISPADQSRGVSEELRALRSREGELQAELEAARSREREARQRLDEQDQMIVTSMTEGRDPAINALRQRALELQQRIATEKEIQGKSEEHPDVAAMLSELQSTEEQLAELFEAEMYVSGRTHTIDDSYQTLVSEVLGSNLRASGIQANLDTIRGLQRATIDEISEFPAQSARYERLKRQVDIKSRTVASLTESYEMARIAEATSTASFSVVDEAIAPRKPSAPSLRNTAMLAFVASLFLSMLVAYWWSGRTADKQEPEMPEEPL